LGRAWNRPTYEALESESAFVDSFDTKDISRMEVKRARAYHTLAKRMMREKVLFSVFIASTVPRSSRERPTL
jgi:hypothetical protein